MPSSTSESGSPGRASIIIAGAQAIYLRIGDSPYFAGVQAFTTDADLTLDPSSIGTDPALEEAMSGAGFHLRGGAEGDPGIWVRPSQVLATGEVCVDLIVPEGLSPPGGRRGVRLDGHSSRAARKIFGLEAVVVDNDELMIESLESDHNRAFMVKVAGFGALFVAKIHKLSDRLQGAERRQSNKDASDVYRLIASITAGELGAVIARLRSDERSAAVTQRALDLLPGLFGTRSSPGVEMCVRALEATVPQETVEAVFVAYMRQLEDEL